MCFGGLISSNYLKASQETSEKKDDETFLYRVLKYTINIELLKWNHFAGYTEINGTKHSKAKYIKIFGI